MISARCTARLTSFPDEAKLNPHLPRIMSFRVACVTKHVEAWFTPPSPSFSSSCRRLVVTSSKREYLAGRESVYVYCG